MKKFLKKYLSVMVVVSVVAILAVVGNCDEATNTAMTTAFSGVKTDVIGAIAVIAPFAIAIMGLFIMWKRGIGFFKSVSK